MDARDRDRLAILTTHEAAIDATLRKKNIPASDIPDLRQEVYRRVLTYLAEREITDAVVGLLVRTAESVASDYWKAQGIALRGAPKLAEDDVAPSNPENEYNEREIRKHLDEILELCEPRGRAVLRARFVQNMTLAQIAKTFGMSKSTAHDLTERTLAALAEAFRKRGITSRAVLPVIVEKAHQQGGTTEQAGGTDKGEAPVSFAAPVTPSVRPPDDFRKPALYTLGGAALGGIIVYLLMQSVVPLARLSPIFVTVAATGQPSVQGGILGMECPLVCPEVVAPSGPASPPPPSGPGQPKIDAKNRYLARAIMAAEERGDCETANKLRRELTGAFAATFELRGACKPTP
ncbi:sigma-70 family RNA polymerase sigma factor [Polyangium sorediatum]|uniref:Sigma-70 family RNA polymerase sigma factor n=1 Tax=Polyangium sorediatum TaxID=889274 RepID=A0ABT6PA24_9BACT|nr:sigma-70 family RNA polymerase sigma factor [Polyangium sorediatum]MDI1437474.1 sigma-70 family RNA polymerase sigma factor [Polyangium sorediatum]